MTIRVFAVLLASTMFLGAAQAAKKETSEIFLDQLVKAALPKDDSVEGILNSGSLGVTLFLLCEVGENAGGKPSSGNCPN